jgi:hypothetical protein
VFFRSRRAEVTIVSNNFLFGCEFVCVVLPANLDSQGLVF